MECWNNAPIRNSTFSYRPCATLNIFGLHIKSRIKQYAAITADATLDFSSVIVIMQIGGIGQSRCRRYIFCFCFAPVLVFTQNLGLSYLERNTLVFNQKRHYSDRCFFSDNTCHLVDKSTVSNAVIILTNTLHKISVTLRLKRSIFLSCSLSDIEATCFRA